MSLAIVQSRASSGIHAVPVSVEVHIANGIPRLSIVGLPETVVKESKDRVRSAIMTSQFEFPSRRITVNLAPADLPKEGGRFDLPIALGILAATRQIPSNELNNYEFAGELALSGELREITGVIPLAIATQQANRHLVIPAANTQQARLISNLSILPAKHLLEVCNHLTHNRIITPFNTEYSLENEQQSLDLADVHGQQSAKRALEIAAAGGHSLLMVGPPGTGKTMLASRLTTLLPQMSETEALATASIHSISNKPFDYRHWRRRPFRSPHHTASSPALVGGGNPPRPGEISLAHNGVLFLDELPEFKRHVLEALREPLESGSITISRAAWQTEFPACFQLIAAMNPCPCGYVGDTNKNCRCTAEQITRYHAKLSGPLLDRIDLHVNVPPLPSNIFTHQIKTANESSQIVRQRIMVARKYQLQHRNTINTNLHGETLFDACQLTEDNKILLERAIQQLNLSARSTHRILRVARTIADLAEHEIIRSDHLHEALSYRCLIHTN